MLDQPAGGNGKRPHLANAQDELAHRPCFRKGNDRDAHRPTTASCRDLGNDADAHARLAHAADRAEPAHAHAHPHRRTVWRRSAREAEWLATVVEPTSDI